MLLPLMAGRRSREAFANQILHPLTASHSGNRTKVQDRVLLWSRVLTWAFVFTYKGRKTPVFHFFKQLSHAAHSLNRNVNRLLSSPVVVFLFIRLCSCRGSTRMRRRRRC